MHHKTYKNTKFAIATIFLMRKNILTLLLFMSALSLGAQDFGYYGSLVSPEEQVSTVSYLSSDAARGRASGSLENPTIVQYIADKFRDADLIPVNWNYTQSFLYGDSTVVRNVVGILPSSVPSDEYVIVSAHYDHLGEIKGRIYPGADDNASGVAAMLSMVKAFRRMRNDGIPICRNVIFVAFDGKELNMCGSKHFVKNLPVPKSSVVCDVNIDMLGTDLVPPGRSKDYIIEVGEETLPARYRGNMFSICFSKPFRMELDQSFYGSRDFRRIFYGMSDQISFSREGIPAVVFSSAFHDHTYKTTDKKEIINFPLLYKRTLVILKFVKMLCDN